MNKKINLKKLIFSLVFDSIGLISFSIPGVGEFADVVWAPLSFWLLTKMYPGRTGQVSGLISFVEEALPGTDLIPTFTLTWLYDTFKKN